MRGSHVSDVLVQRDTKPTIVENKLNHRNHNNANRIKGKNKAKAASRELSS